MTRRDARLDAVVEDCPDFSLLAKAEDLQGMARLDDYRAKSLTDGMERHQVGGGCDAAGAILFGDQRPDLGLRELLAEGFINHAQAGRAAAANDLRVELLFVGDGDR